MMGIVRYIPIQPRAVYTAYTCINVIHSYGPPHKRTDDEHKFVTLHTHTHKTILVCSGDLFQSTVPI